MQRRCDANFIKRISTQARFRDTCSITKICVIYSRFQATYFSVYFLRPNGVSYDARSHVIYFYWAVFFNCFFASMVRKSQPGCKWYVISRYYIRHFDARSL